MLGPITVAQPKVSPRSLNPFLNLIRSIHPKPWNVLIQRLCQVPQCYIMPHCPPVPSPPLKNNAVVVVVVLLQASSMALRSIFRRSSVDQISCLVFPSLGRAFSSDASPSKPIRATLFPGDGIGPEIAESVKQVCFYFYYFYNILIGCWFLSSMVLVLSMFVLCLESCLNSFVSIFWYCLIIILLIDDWQSLTFITVISCYAISVVYSWVSCDFKSVVFSSFFSRNTRLNNSSLKDFLCKTEDSDRNTNETTCKVLQ